MIVVFAILLTTSIASGLANPASNYTKTGECQVDNTPPLPAAIFNSFMIHLPLQHQQACVYDYSVKQEYFGQEGQQNFSITSIVEVNCHSGKPKCTHAWFKDKLF